MKTTVTRDGTDIRELRSVTILLTLSLAIALTVVASLTRTHGQIAGQSLEVSPPSQELTVNPGETTVIKAKVRNRTPNPLPIAVRIEDFVASGAGGQVALTDRGPWSVSGWSTLSPTQFTLESGKEQEVTASVSIPPSGAAGGRYGSFVFSVAGEGGPGVAALSQEVASLFLIRISGPVEEKVTISSFSAPQLLEFGPVEFTLTYENSGNVHLKPQGIITVSDMFGQKTADIPIEAQNVFPAASRSVNAVWNARLLAGRYTATALVYSGTSRNDMLEATTTFVVFPWRIAIVIILIVITLYLLRIRLMKALKALAGK